MGNSMWYSASGERLVSAARDGDLVEAKLLLECNPDLARYSTFGDFNSPLHFASAMCHSEILSLLLENGADVISKNYCGRTALMQACRYCTGKLFRLFFFIDVTRADYLSERTSLCFASVNGHVRCIRLVVANFVPSVPYESIAARSNGNRGDPIVERAKYDQSALSKFVNKAVDEGITALHMASLNAYFDSELAILLCTILLVGGTLNAVRWIPLDVARMWGHDWLEVLLAPASTSAIPVFPRSKYLALPLLSVLCITKSYRHLL